MTTKDKVRTIQILRNLKRNHQNVLNTILDDLGLGDCHFWDIVDNLRDELVCKGALEEWAVAINVTVQSMQVIAAMTTNDSNRLTVPRPA